MKIEIDIDTELINSALKVSNTRSKKRAIEEALKLLIEIKGLNKIKIYRGKLKWTGNLENSRTD